MTIALGDLVEYVGEDDFRLTLYTSHVGRVVDDGHLPVEGRVLRLRSLDLYVGLVLPPLLS